MSVELAYVLINPYTIAKSRTGGVIARYIGRSGLRLVAARMFGPSQALADRYAALIRSADPAPGSTCNLIADYVQRNYSPDPVTHRPQRVMMLLFEGEDAVQRIWSLTGSVTLKAGSGETIRDTYGDYILNDEGRVQYFEPAVLVGPTRERTAATLRLWAQHSETCGGLVSHAADVPEGEFIEKTLVMLKPDNFRYPSLRPGNIVDILSASGLRIIGAKKFCMTVQQAEEFYGPVRQSLQDKFVEIGSARAAAALTREFGFEVSESEVEGVCKLIAPKFAVIQFESIIEFMTGYRPSACTQEEKATAGKEGCLALVYDGHDAVRKIRDILGPTDPTKAKPGSVRREFGSNIMMNAAHASDSVASAVREMNIIRVQDDSIVRLVREYCG
jgi:nucleoside diphosphate kinase